MPNAEARRIATQLTRAVNGPAWHGPSLAGAIRGVSPEQAAKKPLHGVHSIWEIALHTNAWMDIVRQRVEGKPPKVTMAMNWPAVTRTGTRDWRRVARDMRRSASQLARTIRSQDDRTLPYLALHGIVQHTIYHAGQIVILKKGLKRVKR
jgi:uncharacterized damage-inducible protein DinB